MPFDVDFELLSVVTTEDTLSFADGVSNGILPHLKPFIGMVLITDLRIVY